MPHLLAAARVEEVETEFLAQIDTVVGAGPAPTHPDWHCLADGGRDDIFDLTVPLAGGTAGGPGLGRARPPQGTPAGAAGRRQRLPGEIGLGLHGKPARYAELLHDLPTGLNEWAVHPGPGNEEPPAIDPDGRHVRRPDFDFLTSPAARELLRKEGITVTDYRAVQRAWARGGEL
ncbi:ChbG/HpnK family deacetylase [Streptomyces sp. NPDC055287]